MMIFGADKFRDPALLVGRILLAVLFIIFGWGKLTNFSGTMGYFEHDGLPFPAALRGAGNGGEGAATEEPETAEAAAAPEATEGDGDTA